MRGFTLIELLIYIAVFSIVVGIFVSIPPTAFKVQLRESAINEVSSQLNFVLQTVQRLVRESSAIIVNDDGNPDNDGLIGSPHSYLVLRMPDSAGLPTDRDPIVIWKDTNDHKIKMKQGIAQSISDLTTDKVVHTNNVLTFTKFTNYPGHDAVEIELKLNFNSDNPQAQVSRTLKTAVGRISAAVFKDHIVPSSNSTYDLGSNTNPWQNLYLAGDFSIENGKVFQPENYGPAGADHRGFMVTYGDPSQKCSDICSYHTGTCTLAIAIVEVAVALRGQQANCNQSFSDQAFPLGGFCFCE